MIAEHQKLADFIWNIANKLRGPYRPPSTGGSCWWSPRPANAGENVLTMCLLAGWTLVGFSA
jgi:hypothetical protein